MTDAAKTELIGGAIVGLTLCAFIVVGAVSIAVAEPGGWEAWRVALAAWPVGVFVGLLGGLVVVS